MDAVLPNTRCSIAPPAKPSIDLVLLAGFNRGWPVLASSAVVYGFAIGGRMDGFGGTDLPQ